MKSMQEGESVLFNGFRECAKTVYAKYYILWCICYRKKNYIVFFCDEKKKAVDKIMDVASHLQVNKKIINDFGRLYYATKTDKSRKLRQWDFETSNDIKVEAMGVGEVFRWKVYGIPEWKHKGEYRPDLVMMDDIDTNKSTNTTLLIDKGEHYIRNEVFGGISDNSQFIFLYNTIKQDWVWPRLWRDRDDWKRMHIPMINDDLDPDSITWKRRYTLEDVNQKKKNSGQIAFNQNYLLIPYMGGQAIIQREWIHYKPMPERIRKIVIGVDPSISKNDYADMFGIVVAAFDWEKKYILEVEMLDGESKSLQNACNIIESLYNKYNASSKIINFEANGFQQTFSEELKKRRLAVNEMKTTKDKITRLTEYQLDFERGHIMFVSGAKNIGTLEEQLLNFPNSRYDDLVDALMFAIYDPKLPRWFLNGVR